MVSHPEQDILESEVKWALGSNAVTKARGCDRIPVELSKTPKMMSSRCCIQYVSQHIGKTQQQPQDWKRSILIQIPKKGSTKECANHRTIALISHANKVMLEILHARLQHYVNQDLPDVQAKFRKGRGNRDQIANIQWIIEKAREFQKPSTSVSLTTPKPLTVWITINSGKLLKEMGIPDHLTCLLRNLYAGQ